MTRILTIITVLAVAALSSASAETVKFEDSAALLGAACARDIDANCRGVNLDPQRMKDCLLRNQDVLTPQCKSEYSRAFDAIQKRVAARLAVQKGDRGAAIDCLLTGPRGIGINCGKSLGEAGFR
jgi:hypothetical protein